MGSAKQFLRVGYAVFGVVGAAAVATACSFDDGMLAPDPGPTMAAPHVVALSTYASSLGTPIDVHGSGFPEPSRGRTTLNFRGRFNRAGGGSNPVELEVEPRRIDASTLRWTTFGPYANPFGVSGDEIGSFDGAVFARVYDPSGDQLDDDQPIDINFEVAPSIIVREMQPTTATCNGAVKRALSGASYRLSVEAVGFTPASFTYTVSVPNIYLEPISVRHVATGQFDSVGERGDFVMPFVPEDAQYYSAIVTIEARDAAGRSHGTAFAISVHRPIEVYYDGNIEVAEVLAPVPVSGCIPGGEAGRHVEYGEMMQETRTRGYNVSWNESWLDTHTVSQGSMQTIGINETNGVGFSTTDEENWNWSLGGEVGGEFGLSKLVSLSMKVSGSVGGGGSHANTASQNHEQGLNASTTTTDTEEASTSLGGQQGETFNWDVSSSDSISRSFGGNVIAKTYGVFYRQTLRLSRKASVVTYNQCGAANVVGEVELRDWTWSPDLALGNACPPLPASNLPEARCIIPPCAGE